MSTHIIICTFCFYFHWYDLWLCTSILSVRYLSILSKVMIVRKHFHWSLASPISLLIFFQFERIFNDFLELLSHVALLRCGNRVDSVQQWLKKADISPTFTAALYFQHVFSNAFRRTIPNGNANIFDLARLPSCSVVMTEILSVYSILS